MRDGGRGDVHVGEEGIPCSGRWGFGGSFLCLSGEILAHKLQPPGLIRAAVVLFDLALLYYSFKERVDRGGDFPAESVFRRADSAVRHP